MFGLLNQRQFRILKLRTQGLSQQEAAREIGTSRANVSMIESRARKKVERARETLQAYESIQTYHVITVEKGTKLVDVPSMVLLTGDKYHLHVQSNLVEIVRMVKSVKPGCLKDGKTIREIKFRLNERGKLILLK